MADDMRDDAADDIEFDHDPVDGGDDEQLSVDEIARILRDFATGERSFNLAGVPAEDTPSERCPSCGENQVFRIVYGFPSRPLPSNGIVGGCIVGPGSPRKGCKACGWRPSFLEALQVGEARPSSPFRFPVTADNEMPQDEDPSDFDDAHADIERWIAKYSDGTDEGETDR